MMENGSVLEAIVPETGCPVAYPSLEGAECPYPFYSWARAQSPVYQLPGRPFYFLTRFEDVRYVADNPELFSSVGRTLGTQPESKPVTKSGLEIRALMESDAPDHGKHRKFSKQLITPREIKALRPVVAEITDGLIDSFIDAGECDFVTAFAAKLPALVTARIMGLPDTLIEELNQWGQIEASGAPFLPAERFQEHVGRREAMALYVQQALQERIKTPANDGLTLMLRSQIERDGELSLPYVTLQAAVFMAGGTSTTAHMLSMALLLLLEHPNQMEKLVADPQRISDFLDEAMRVESPIQWVPRRVTQDVTISGVEIPAGSHVILGLGAANRDDTRFAEPESFDIDRDDSHDHLAFGRGPHACVGQALAKLEMVVTFERLLARVKDLRRHPECTISHIESPSFRGLKSLRIQFTLA